MGCQKRGQARRWYTLVFTKGKGQRSTPCCGGMRIRVANVRGRTNCGNQNGEPSAAAMLESKRLNRKVVVRQEPAKNCKWHRRSDGTGLPVLARCSGQRVVRYNQSVVKICSSSNACASRQCVTARSARTRYACPMALHENPRQSSAGKVKAVRGPTPSALHGAGCCIVLELYPARCRR